MKDTLAPAPASIWALVRGVTATVMPVAVTQSRADVW